MLVLSGCSGSSTSPASNSSGAGQMQEGPQEQNSPSFASLMHGQYGPVESVVVQLPEDLKKVMGAEGEEIRVEKFKITGHPLKSAKYCAVDIETTFTEAGSPERAAQDARTVLEYEKVDEWLESLRLSGNREEVYMENALFAAASIYGGTFYPTPSSTAVFLDKAIEAAENGDSRADDILKHFDESRVDFNQLVADFRAKRAEAHEEVANIPLPDLFTSLEALGAGWIGIWDKMRPLADFSDSSPEPGVYVSEDGTKAIRVGDCERQTESQSEKLDFESHGSNDPLRSNSVANLSYSVRSDGMVTITGASVKKYELDPAGNWLEKKI